MALERLFLPPCPFGEGKCSTRCPNHGFAVIIELLNNMVPEDIRPQVEASRDQASLEQTADGMCVKLWPCAQQKEKPHF